VSADVLTEGDTGGIGRTSLTRPGKTGTDGYPAGLRDTPGE
jgi:hypothetical protein